MSGNTMDQLVPREHSTWQALARCTPHVKVFAIHHSGVYRAPHLLPCRASDSM